MDYLFQFKMPDGRILDLPAGASTVDVAAGFKCLGCRVLGLVSACSAQGSGALGFMGVGVGDLRQLGV